jgi:hypothetical protein
VVGILGKEIDGGESRGWGLSESRAEVCMIWQRDLVPRRESMKERGDSWVHYRNCYAKLALSGLILFSIRYLPFLNSVYPHTSMKLQASSISSNISIFAANYSSTPSSFLEEKASL